MPHYDFVYAIIKLYIPHDLLCDILTMNPSINYDQLKNELTIRADSMKTNMATLTTILRMINDYKENNNTVSQKPIL